MPESFNLWCVCLGSPIHQLKLFETKSYALKHFFHRDTQRASFVSPSVQPRFTFRSVWRGVKDQGPGKLACPGTRASGTYLYCTGVQTLLDWCTRIPGCCRRQSWRCCIRTSVCSSFRNSRDRTLSGQRTTKRVHPFFSYIALWGHSIGLVCLRKISLHSNPENPFDLQFSTSP